MATAPAARTVLARKKPGERKAAPKPAKSIKDWKDEELHEAESRPVRPFAGQTMISPEDMVVGDNYKFLNWSDPKWVDKDGARVMVAYYYPSQNVAIDFPDSADEMKIKQAFFKGLKIPYLGVLADEPLRAKEARAFLTQQGAKLAA